MSRGLNRLRAAAGALLDALTTSRLRSRPAHPQKILVLHELLLGDTLMLAPLLAALRYQYATAEIFVTANPAYARLFSGRPYGVRVLPYSTRQPHALEALSPARDCDLAILPGENSHAIAARSIGAKWITGFAEGRPGWRNHVIDEPVSFPGVSMALADMFVLLSGGEQPSGNRMRYKAGDWPAPECTGFPKPQQPYAVLHVGAGSPRFLGKAPPSCSDEAAIGKTAPSVR
jgi:ADP-heptose:LPS heptosyltransferase